MSELNKITFTTKKPKYEVFLQLMKELESNLAQSLTSRNINIEEYCYKVYKLAQMVFCFDKGNDQTIGVAIFYANDKHTKCAYLSFIALKKGYFNKGYGTKLLNECICISKSKGMNTFRLRVHDARNLATNFYKNNGFKISENIGQSIFMVKDI